VINLDFSVAVSGYICLLLAALLFFWIFGRKQKEKDLPLESKFIWFCSVCTYTYVDTKEEVISICPRCGSYNKKC